MKIIKDFWCPSCKKKGLHPYNKDGTRPDLTDDITHMSCLYCGYEITSCKKEKEK